MSTFKSRQEYLESLLSKPDLTAGQAMRIRARLLVFGDGKRDQGSKYKVDYCYSGSRMCKAKV